MGVPNFKTPFVTSTPKIKGSFLLIKATHFLFNQINLEKEIKRLLKCKEKQHLFPLLFFFPLYSIKMVKKIKFNATNKSHLISLT